mmetsp:Transcript_13135/g.38663  ORF Transcript_13135/g.38663 Transcript_13135/m.38663 type:complete len:256 (-) Transcript_13135:843-1610(-)
MGPRFRRKSRAHPPLLHPRQIDGSVVSTRTGTRTVRIRLRGSLSRIGHVRPLLGISGDAVRTGRHRRAAGRRRHARAARGGAVQLQGAVPGQAGSAHPPQDVHGRRGELQGESILHRVPSPRGRVGVVRPRNPPPPPPSVRRIRRSPRGPLRSALPLPRGRRDDRVRIVRGIVDPPLHPHRPLPLGRRDHRERLRLPSRAAQIAHPPRVDAERHPQMRGGVPVLQPARMRRGASVLRRVRHDRVQRGGIDEGVPI